jgi:RNA polymerase sigma factor (sigma-70 family)
MDQRSVDLRLSRISTVWTMLRDAHQPDAAAGAAPWSLIQRYQRAVYRYVLGAVRDEDAADELFQEFALRVVRGAFRNADPKRGRFRDYLKTVLIHLVTDYRNRERNQLRPLDFSAAERPADDVCLMDEQFIASWREELLARAWAALQDEQRRRGQPYYSVLRYRAEHPDASSAEMAAQLSKDLCSECALTETAVRKLLQRARARFADALLDEVAGSLDNPTHDQIEQELIELDLLPHCRSALTRREH